MNKPKFYVVKVNRSLKVSVFKNIFEKIYNHLINLLVFNIILMITKVGIENALKV